MVTKLPLDVDGKNGLRDLKNALTFLLGDDLARRCPSEYSTDITIPSILATSNVIGTPPPRSAGASIGSVLTFKRDTPFAMVHLSYDVDAGPTYSLGAHAGWQKAGSDDGIREYWQALDTLLGRLGVLADQYQFECPCGHSTIVDGGYIELNDAISDHYSDDHDEPRISTSTLVGKEITVPDSAPSAEPAATPSLS